MPKKPAPPAPAARKQGKKKGSTAKRVFAFGGLLIAAGSAFLYGSTAQRNSVVKEVSSLIAKGETELAPCRLFKEKLEDFNRDELNSESPSHANKGEAMGVLALLETYPGTPPSFYQAARLLDDNHESLLRYHDQPALVAKRHSLQAECEIFAMALHSQLLLSDISALGFQGSEAARVRRMVAAYLKAEQPAISMVSLGIKAALLQKYIEVRPESKAAAASADAFLELFEKKRVELDLEFQRAGRERQNTLASFTPELKAVRELNAEYARLLAEAGI